MRRADKIEVYQRRGVKPFGWRIRCSNGEVLSSAQGYTRKGTAFRVAYRFIVRVGELGLALVDLTAKPKRGAK